MQYNKKFYQKYSMKITDEPVITHNERFLSDAIERLGRAVKKDYIPNNIVIELEQVVERYPNIPSLKNYLYIAYVRNNQKEKASQTLNKTVEQHPNYIFAYLNLANRLIDENNYNKAADLLKAPYDIRKFEQDEYIHESAFLSYYTTAIRIEVLRDNLTEVEKIHRMLFDYDPSDKELERTAMYIQAAKFRTSAGRKARNEREVIIMPRAINGYYLSDKQGKPVFNHTEIHALYQYNLDNIPKNVVETILNLPRQTLIQDLEHALMDTILRFDSFQKDEWNEESNNFFIHALYMLTELKAYESVPIILDFLSQEEDFMDYWLGDAGLEYYFSPTLYLLANNQLEVLKEFAIRENTNSWSRLLASEIAVQIAIKQPERRGEVIDWFKYVMRYHLDNADNDNLIDTIYLSSMMGDMINFNAIELEEDIKTLYETGWIDDSFAGNLDEILKELHEPFNPFHDYPLPLNIFELYTGEYKKRQKKSNRPIDPELENILNDPYHNYMVKVMAKQLSKIDNERYSFDDDEYDDEYDDDEYSAPQLPIKREEPKVGRNDPCPCGSGKKYKKCHGN